MTSLPRQSDGDGLLCKRCDVYVGFGAVGVVKPPIDLPDDQWNHVCWVCRRTADEIEESQLPEAEAGVGDEQELAAGVDRREGVAAPSQPRDSRPPRQGHLRGDVMFVVGVVLGFVVAHWWPL